ncbi:hypothetical protein MTsDn1_29580 [Alteromonas sp. MTD1]|uniref:hypothetical protein n=1 Tax=Alteromonas sp. MTD1 TaxID=3057962 RepID=UPI0036F1D548
MKRIAFVVKTAGLEFDDRVRKEALSIRSIGYDVTIFVQLNSNLKETGTTSYGIAYESIELETRNFLPSSRFLLIKAFEFYLRLRGRLNQFDYVWCHEEYTFIFPLLIAKNKVIWDLHELPIRFNTKFMQIVYRAIEARCLSIVHANKYRLQFLKNTGLVRKTEKNFVINNYPDDRFLKSTIKSSVNDDFIKWKGQSNYVYLQGLTTSKRLPYNTLKAVLTAKCRAVIVGNIEKGVMERLKEEFGEVEVQRRLFLTGMIEQMAIRNLLIDAQFTIVLYDDSTPNNRYCEANRLYQSILSRVPVIVGANPPMAQLVMSLKCGVVLDDFGDDLESLTSAVLLMKHKSQEYTVNERKLEQLLWSDTQVFKLMTYVEKNHD